jgi:vitamin B12 transporter
VLGAGFIHEHGEGSLHLNYQFNYNDRFYWDDSLDKASFFIDWAQSQYIGRTHFAELYDSWKWTHWELLSGVDFRYNNTNQYYRSQSPAFPPFSPSPTIYETSINNKNTSQISPYVSIIYKQENFNLEFGGRWNYHSEYGNNVTYTLNPSYTLHHSIKLFANLYSAYKVPTLYQLFDPSAGTKDLQPEKNVVAEAGAEIFNKKSFDIRLVGFYRNTKNSIQYIEVDPSTYDFRYRNISRQENYGAEMEANYEYQKWNIRANYTYTDGKTRSKFDGTGSPLGKDTTYYNLYRIPKHVFNFSIGMQATKAFYVSGYLHVSGKRQEFIYGSIPERLDGYATVDLHAEYKFMGKYKLFINLNNITNKKYFDIPGYTTKRFNFTTGLNLSL